MLNLARPRLEIPRWRAPKWMQRHLSFPLQGRVLGLPFAEEASAPATLGLLTNLVAWWELDEASGNRADSHTNGLTLTDNNTVGSASGIGGVGTAAQFIHTNSEYFSRANETLLQTGNLNWAECVWINRNVSGYATFIFSKDDVSTNREYTLGWESAADTLVFRVFNGTSPVATLGSAISITTGAWHFIMMWCSVTDGKIYLSIDNGTVEQANISGTPAAGTAPLYVGVQAANTFSGKMSKIGFWKNFTPTTQNITDLYNSGAGRTYSEL